MLLGTVSLGILTQLTAKFHIVTAAEHKQSGNHQALGLAALSLVLGSLETLIGII